MGPPREGANVCVVIEFCGRFCDGNSREINYRVIITKWKERQEFGGELALGFNYRRSDESEG